MMFAHIRRPRTDLHHYQHDAIAFLTADVDARQLIAVMGSGKTAIALHALSDLKQRGELDNIIPMVADHVRSDVKSFEVFRSARNVSK